MRKTLFDDAWKQWIRHNLERGCSRDELFRILLDEGYDHGAIAAELQHEPSRDLALVRNPLRPSAPLVGRATQKPDPRALPDLKRWETPHLELYTAEAFLDQGTCAELVELMRGHLRQSEISAADEADRAFRVSRTCDLDLLAHAAVTALNDRICRAMQCTTESAEMTQAQYYDVGGEFKPHTDYFKPYEIEKFCTPTLGQRTWTFMVYLNRPERGGETVFTAAGLTMTPKVGRAVIWNNLLPDGSPNPGTIHHGTPVASGYKAIITKWFRAPRAAAH